MTRRIYIDTSVFGGYFDDEFKEATIPFFEKLIAEGITVIISEVLELEIYRAPKFIRDFFESIPAKLIERVELSEEVQALADKYIFDNVVGKTSRADCQHIALATIYRADVLVSWNFKHIVNLARIRGYNSVNLKLGYPIIEIRSPKEIINYEE